MTFETPDPIPFLTRPAQEQAPFVLDTAAASHTTRAATPEEIRAVEALFAHQSAEGPSFAGLIGAYGAGMLLHDIMKDTFTSEDDEEDDGLQKPQLKRD